MYTQSGNANSNQYKNGGNSGDSLKVGLITKHTQNDKSYSMLKGHRRQVLKSCFLSLITKFEH